jgi:DNA modification methylase
MTAVQPSLGIVESQPTLVYSSDTVDLWCGRAEDVLPRLDSWSVDMIAMDPPYGAKWQSGRRNDRFATISGDDDASFVHEVLRNCLRVLREQRHVYVFGPLAFDGLPIGGTAELIWDKEHRGAGNLEIPWGPGHERIAFGVYVSRPSGRGRGDGRLAARLRQGSVLRVPRLNSADVRRHPTEKPVRLMRNLIESSSCAGDVVLDPFAGVGSTGVAAILSGRRALLVELDCGYCNIAAARLRAADELMSRAVRL